MLLVVRRNYKTAIIVDDHEDVVGVAVAQVPDDRELALALQQGRLLARLIA